MPHGEERTPPTIVCIKVPLSLKTATAPSPSGAAARESVVVHHPLQPFDPKNFRPGGLSRSGPWSFDPVFLAGALVPALLWRRLPATVSTIWIGWNV